MNRFARIATIVAVVCLSLAATSCVAVKPWERDLLARPDPALRVPRAVRERVEDHLPAAGADGILGTFTRSYGRAISGAGPVLWEESGPRYFSPEEILRLHEHPEWFAFPPSLSRRTRWRLAGNGVHVGCAGHVASVLEQTGRTA